MKFSKLNPFLQFLVVLLVLFLIANVWWIGRSFQLYLRGDYPSFWLSAEHAGDHWGVSTAGYANFWYTHQITLPQIFGWLIKAGEWFFNGVVWISTKIGDLFTAPP